MRAMARDRATTERARAVRDMFGAIARRYDFLNHFLSLNVDRRWRNVCVRAVAARAAAHPGILDVGCGTADLSIALSALGTVTGCDFCHPMLRIGNDKLQRTRSANPVRLIEGDALSLPFADGTFDVVASAFVLRNLADIDAGFAEMGRVLKRGGTLAVLDFSMPTMPLVGSAYRFYFSRVLPAIGRAVSGVEGPYRYLPESVGSFPAPEELGRRAAAAGFSDVGHRRLTGGIAFLLVAVR